MTTNKPSYSLTLQEVEKLIPVGYYFEKNNNNRKPEVGDWIIALKDGFFEGFIILVSLNKTQTNHQRYKAWDFLTLETKTCKKNNLFITEYSTCVPYLNVK